MYGGGPTSVVPECSVENGIGGHRTGESPSGRPKYKYSATLATDRVTFVRHKQLF